MAQLSECLDLIAILVLITPAQKPWTPIAKGIRVYRGIASSPAEEVQPPSSRKNWTRRELAEWLCKGLSNEIPAIVGIDHAFSFPLAYFDKYGLPENWPQFLEDFQRHWPTDVRKTHVKSIRERLVGEGPKRSGDSSWLRLAERWTPTAKSVFRFGVQGEVATSTHAGLPWLLYLRKKSRHPLHFWPFDGWDFPKGASVVAEVYPSLWMRRFDRSERDNDRQAAYVVATWLQWADLSGSLANFFNPSLTQQERELATIEGWILGVL